MSVRPLNKALIPRILCFESSVTFTWKTQKFVV